MELEEYRPLSKSMFLEEGYNEEQWLEMKLYAEHLAKWSSEAGVEDAPEIRGDNIEFKSFTGLYYPEGAKHPVSFRVNHDKIPETHYKTMLHEVEEWCNLIGPTILSQLIFHNPQDIKKQILAYSNKLIQINELARNTYLSPIIKKHVIKDAVPHGRLDLARTTRNLIQGSTQLVSLKTRAIKDTLPILLLIRFNLELTKHIQEFLSTFNPEDPVKTALERLAIRNLQFHHDILFNPRFAHLIDVSLETDLYDPEVLEETYRQSNGNPIYHDMVYLWEGYISGRSLYVSLLEDQYGGYTLKPMSKIYELWLLRQITRILDQKLGEPEVLIHPKCSMTFKYREPKTQYILTYNVTIPEKWKKFKELPVKMRPDYLLVKKVGGKCVPVLIADAKYKASHGGGDIQQMLAYMLALGWGGETREIVGSILYIGSLAGKGKTREEVSRTRPDATINLVKINPGSTNTCLEQIITKALNI